jgi:hypothetical protein
MPYVCDEKTSAAMACCDVKGLGGEDDVELLMDPCINGLLERFEGLVLLGLGPPAISSFVVAVVRRPCWEQRAAVEARRVGGGEADKRGRLPETSGSKVSTAVRAQRQRLPGCKTTSKRGYAQVNF